MTLLGRKSRKALSAVMAIWLSGIVLLFCCEMQAMEPEVESCPLAKLAPEDCNKTNAGNASTLITDSGANAGKCCVFIAGVFEKTRKLEQHLVFTKPADKPVRLGRQIPAIRERFAEPHSYVSFSRPAHKIFIQHNVFRI